MKVEQAGSMMTWMDSCLLESLSILDSGMPF